MVERCADIIASHIDMFYVNGAPPARAISAARAVIEALMEPTKPMVFFGMDAMARDDLEPTEDEFRAGFVAALRTALGTHLSNQGEKE